MCNGVLLNYLTIFARPLVVTINRAWIKPYRNLAEVSMLSLVSSSKSSSSGTTSGTNLARNYVHSLKLSVIKLRAREYSCTTSALRPVRLNLSRM